MQFPEQQSPKPRKESISELVRRSLGDVKHVENSVETLVSLPLSRFWALRVDLRLRSAQVLT